MKNVLIALVALVLFGCQEDKQKKVTSEGFEYTIEHTNPDGKKVQDKDWVAFTFEATADGTKSLQKIDKGPMMPIIKVEFDAEKRKMDPIPEVLQQVQVGDDVSISVPVDSFPTVPPALKEYKNLVYKLHIESVMNQTEYDAYQEKQRVEREKKIKFYKEREKEIIPIVEADIDNFKSKKAELQQTENGVEYIIHEEGKGENIKKGETANVMYYGCFHNKKSFDNSFSRGMPIPVNVGAGMVIKGWDEALQSLKKGSKATLFIPSDLAYGATDKGGIPANSDLVFYIEVLEK